MTHDGEFFELTVSKDSTAINKRAFAEAVNRFGGNCFGCHVNADPNWDFICETGHGCDHTSLTTPMIKALQHTDPRCEGSEHVNAEDAAILWQLDQFLRPKTPPAEKPG